MMRKIGLDLPRAIAITLVIGSHFAQKLHILGFYGVELFFALSGFLIGGILCRDLTTSSQWSFSHVTHFWQRRWWRTLPNYYLFLLVSVVFHFFAGGFPSGKEFMPFLVFSQSLLQGNSFFYGVSWSLCIEEWFYLLFPLCILLLLKGGFSKKVAFIGSTLLFLIVPMLLREVLLKSHPPETVRLMTLARLDSIFYGVAMAFVTSRFNLSRDRRSLMFLGGVCLVGGSGLVGYLLRSGDLLLFYKISFCLVPGGFALMLPWLETVHHLPKSLGWATRGIRNFSLWSYSIYLSHIPVLFTVYALLGSLRENVLVNLASKVAGLAITLFISRVLYLRFEVPLTALRPRERGEVAGRAPPESQPTLRP